MSCRTLSTRQSAAKALRALTQLLYTDEQRKAVQQLEKLLLNCTPEQSAHVWSRVSRRARAWLKDLAKTRTWQSFCSIVYILKVWDALSCQANWYEQLVHLGASVNSILVGLGLIWLLGALWAHILCEFDDTSDLPFEGRMILSFTAHFVVDDCKVCVLQVFPSQLVINVFCMQSSGFASWIHTPLRWTDTNSSHSNPVLRLLFCPWITELWQWIKHARYSFCMCTRNIPEDSNVRYGLLCSTFRSSKHSGAFSTVYMWIGNWNGEPCSVICSEQWYWLVSLYAPFMNSNVAVNEPSPPVKHNVVNPRERGFQ